jgi:alpha/beta hydrolase fold
VKLLPHSNGFYKVNMKNKLKPKDIIRNIFLSLIILVAIGFIYQRISNFIAKETLKQRVDYVRVDDKRLDYKTNGEGKYTIIFDGNIGTNLSQWNIISDKLTLEYDDITTFVYNRRGYGYSDSGSLRTPKEQAEDLRLLLRKSAVSAPYILVGEEYGSLVLAEFAKEYPDLVAGVVLVNPFVEDNINTKEFKNNLMIEKVRRNIEKIGSSIGITTLMDKLNLACDTEDFKNKLDDISLNEFNVHRTKSNYTSAVYNELQNITSGESNTQEDGIFSGKPYYLIAKDGQEQLASLGDEELTKVHTINSDSKIIAMYEPDSVISGIRQVIKQANEIERVQKKATKN